jgi:hypothetical protein
LKTAEDLLEGVEIASPVEQGTAAFQAERGDEAVDEAPQVAKHVTHVTGSCCSLVELPRGRHHGRCRSNPCVGS